MRSTGSKDESTRTADGQVRLRVEVYDTLAAAKGYKKVAQQARWHGIARSAMFRVRAGGTPRFTTAVKMAADLGVAVEVIWERVAA